MAQVIPYISLSLIIVPPAVHIPYQSYQLAISIVVNQVIPILIQMAQAECLLIYQSQVLIDISVPYQSIQSMMSITSIHTIQEVLLKYLLN